MSPEIFQNKPYSYKSDVWALGCVLYEMTTLNHAFDANSLNGLATKIIKGKYPPVHTKYSRYLRELIAQMLMLNPQQRPDLDQILRKPFIKKHVVNFFVDIASRPSQSIGEGTMIFKVAAGGVGGAGGQSIMNDTNMISLRQQLHQLDMTQSVADAMQPKTTPPVDDQEALRLARDQASALRREQEHKRMVEAALEKLRQEREMRVKQRQQQDGFGRAARPPLGGPGAVAGQRDPRRPQAAPSAAPSALAAPANRPPVEAKLGPSPTAAGGGAVRDRGINWMRRPEEAPAVAPPRDDNGAGRRRSYGEEPSRDRKASAAAVAAEEAAAANNRRRQLLLQQQQQQEALAAAARLAEDRRREEVKAEARLREEARIREEAKQKEEQLERVRMEQVRERAEAAAKAKREALREKEREKEKEKERLRLLEIEQLKRDKLELDRRTNQRAAAAAQAAERAKREQLDALQEKLDHMNEQISRLEIPAVAPRNRVTGDQRAEDKNGDELISARERVYRNKQAKQERDEEERRKLLLEAENENRRLRQQAVENKQKIYADHAGVLPGYAASNSNMNNGNNKYEFDRNRQKARMDPEELNDRLEEATRGKGSRFDSSPMLPTDWSGAGSESRKTQRTNSDLGPISGSGSGRSSNPPKVNPSSSLEINTDSGSDEDLFEKGEGEGGESDIEEEEDLLHREEELRAELQFATQRVEDLRRTLQETKSFLGPRVPTRQGPVGPAGGGLEPIASHASKPKLISQQGSSSNDRDDEEVEEDEEDLFDLEEEEEYEESWDDPSRYNSKSNNSGNGVNANKKMGVADRPIAPAVLAGGADSRGDFSGENTVRRMKAPDPGAYDHGVSSSPSGRLSDRIERLRQLCIEGLGRDAFFDAYHFLKQHEEESQGYDNGRDLNDEDFEAKKMARCRAILGEGKMQYVQLIDQLIFMEETHLG
eukprot:scaffold1159_cov160-Ochromonas_danica.AAC.5